jgi:hypothetical protein
VFREGPAFPERVEAMWFPSAMKRLCPVAADVAPIQS